jgi:hypothetical protein
MFWLSTLSTNLCPRRVLDVERKHAEARLLRVGTLINLT